MTFHSRRLLSAHPLILEISIFSLTEPIQNQNYRLEISKTKFRVEFKILVNLISEMVPEIIIHLKMGCLIDDNVTYCSRNGMALF
jgi:hypothetical protein